MQRKTSKSSCRTLSQQSPRYESSMISREEIECRLRGCFDDNDDDAFNKIMLVLRGTSRISPFAHIIWYVTSDGWLNDYLSLFPLWEHLAFLQWTTWTHCSLIPPLLLILNFYFWGGKICSRFTTSRKKRNDELPYHKRRLHCLKTDVSQWHHSSCKQNPGLFCNSWVTGDVYCMSFKTLLYISSYSAKESTWCCMMHDGSKRKHKPLKEKSCLVSQTPPQ